MTNCIACGAKNKTIIGDEIIRTRIPGQEEILVKDVHYDQCTICETKSITESSQIMISKIRKHYVDDYYKQNRSTVESAADNVKDFFKKFGVFN